MHHGYMNWDMNRMWEIQLLWWLVIWVPLAGIVWAVINWSANGARPHHAVAWIIPAFLGIVAGFALMAGTMPGMLFSLVLIALALFCAAKAYAATNGKP